MDQLVTQEVQSGVFREMLVKSLQLKEDLNFQLLVELKITSEDDAGTMALSASISDLPTTTADRILDVVDKYVRCRARGHSITCAQLVAMPVTPTDETKVSETVRKIVQEYPLVDPSLLRSDSVYKSETYSIETYVLKDELFAWYYEVDRSADGQITGIREPRVAQ